MTDQPPTPEARREQWRRAAEKQRLKRGIAPVKGTVIPCSTCGERFTRNSVKAVRCKPCQREDILQRARAASRAAADQKGWRKVGQTAACDHCRAPYAVTAGAQRYCDDCRKLQKAGRLPHIRANNQKAAARYAERHPERIKELQRESRERRKQNPAFTVNERMSAGVRYSLAAGKQGSSWETLVGYTKDDLVAHLEKQFLPGMSWDRREEFHIDHIVPLASFRFETAEDPDFRAAWGLANLRPLWARENRVKSARRTHLL